jgi:dihydroxy-acid dehydratase
MNKYSSHITQPRSQGASQAMLYGVGLTQADLQKAQVGICSMWYEGNPCNMHLDRLAVDVKAGVEAAGLVGMRFNTIGVSDAISMGTSGMSFSLPSRDLIADSIETVMGAQWYDALVTVPGCDKNMPGSVMAMARLNRPALMVYGGTIKPGHAQGQVRDIISAFQSYGQFLAGVITDEQRLDIVKHSCPGAAPAAAFTLPTNWPPAIEALGPVLRSRRAG